MIGTVCGRTSQKGVGFEASLTAVGGWQLGRGGAAAHSPAQAESPVSGPAAALLQDRVGLSSEEYQASRLARENPEAAGPGGREEQGRLADSLAHVGWVRGPGSVSPLACRAAPGSRAGPTWAFYVSSI